MGYVSIFLEFIRHVADGVRDALLSPGESGGFLRYLVSLATVLAALSLIVACLRFFVPSLGRYLHRFRAAAQSGYDWHDPLVSRYTLNKKILEEHLRGGTGDVKAQFIGFPGDGEMYSGDDDGIGFAAEHLQSFFDEMPAVFRETIRYINFPDSWSFEGTGLPDELRPSGVAAIFVRDAQTIHVNPWWRNKYPEKVEGTLYHEAYHSYEHVYHTVEDNLEYYEYLKGLEGMEVEGINKDPGYYTTEEFVAQSYARYKVDPDDTYFRTPMTYSAMAQLDNEIFSRSVVRG